MHLGNDHQLLLMNKKRQPDIICLLRNTIYDEVWSKITNLNLIKPIGLITCLQEIESKNMVLYMIENSLHD